MGREMKMNTVAISAALALSAVVSALPVLDDIPQTMLAARSNSTCQKHGDFASCIEVVTVKTPKPMIGEALVRMSTSSVNPSDCDIVEGLAGRLIGTRLGVDFAGEVVSKGALCSNLQVGDKVRGATLGAFAEYAIVYCAITGKLGDSVSPAAVGTLPEVSMTSAEALKKTGAPWGKAKNYTVVITSGSGGTGFVGVQLAKAYGAGKVITATSGAANIDFVKSIGADVVIDFKEQDIFSALQNDTVDIVYDNFGAAGTADRAMPKLKAGGVFVFLPGKDGALSKHPKPGVKQINYGLMVPSARTLDEMLALYQSGALKAHVQATYPLSNISAAYQASASGTVVGKVAVSLT